MYTSAALPTSQLFNQTRYPSDPRANAELAYLRAEAIAKSYNLTWQDALKLSPKFFDIHADPITSLDASAVTLLTIHFNLCIGTIAGHAKDRTELKGLLQDLTEFKKIGQFCLTEVGHGLDADNLETTATLLPDGRFDLHTPNDQSAKFMPPTIPVLGRPCVAIVFARLSVSGEERGIRPFIVQLNDGVNMSEGISARLLPPRNGYNSVNHSITWFDHVKLPSTALLGTLMKPKSEHLNFLSSIWRVSVGTLSLSFVPIEHLRIACHIAYKYSCRRKVHNSDGSMSPIISFSTQQIPIVRALAQFYVLTEFRKKATQIFTDTSIDARVRHGVAACFKSLVLQCSQTSHFDLSERLGAQGLFDYNQIVNNLTSMRGIAIAEGDTLVLSIRLISELLQGRYTMPPSSDPNGLLYKYELGIFGECKDLLSQYGHRSREFAYLVLPRCRVMVESIARRMAYDATVAAGVPQPLLDAFLCQAMGHDLAWYVEAGYVSRAQFTAMEYAAISATVPHLEQWVEKLQAGPYVKAPIVSEEKWKEFVLTLDISTSSDAGIRRAVL